MKAVTYTKGSNTQSSEATWNVIKVKRHEHFRVTPLTSRSEPKHKEANYYKHL